ncbi:hypothetical protein CK203_023150 [Vitis vinifera]|uniref:Uncharacterized protein n=1 Tax=Vitis vinifera TaxID=29760 RepID=A0A438J1S0_VITVI|nr:hypothetical protein CK203_023150 [Vitis vinifera]
MTKGKSGVTFAINQDIQGRLVGSYMEKQQTKRAIDQPDKANSRGFQSEQQSVSTSRGAEMPLFSKDRIEQPFKLLNKIQNPTSSPSSSCSLAQKVCAAAVTFSSCQSFLLVAIILALRCAVVTSSPLASTFPQNPTLALSRTHHTRGIAPLPLLQLMIFRCNQRNSTVIRVVTAILVPCHRRHRHLSISSSPRASP